MIIYFLRHANAGERVNNPKKDEKRALDQIGIEQCGNVGRALAALDTRVEVIISSPLKRAAQTASLVATRWATKASCNWMTRFVPMPHSPTSANFSISTPSTM